MHIGIIDIFYIIIAFQLSVFTVFLLIRRKTNPSNLMLGIQLISQAFGILAGTTYRLYGYSNPVAAGVIYVSGSFMFLWGPTFYLYIKQISYKDFRFTPFQVLHFIPFFIFTSYAILSFITTEANMYLVFSSNYANIFVRVQVLFYIILSVNTSISVKKSLMGTYSSINKTNWYWIRFLVTGFITAYILTIPIIIYRYFGVSNEWLELGNMLPYFIFFNFIFFKAWYNPEIFLGMSEIVKYKSSKLTKDEAEKLIKKLNYYICNKKPFLNPDITINQMADELEINSRFLSQIINEYFSQNFYDFINKLRIEESKKLLISDRKKTILEILYEVGFNTKSAYNNAFKKTTGLTPSEYRKTAGELIGSSSDS